MVLYSYLIKVTLHDTFDFETPSKRAYFKRLVRMSYFLMKQQILPICDALKSLLIDSLLLFNCQVRRAVRGEHHCAMLLRHPKVKVLSSPPSCYRTQVINLKPPPVNLSSPSIIHFSACQLSLYHSCQNSLLHLIQAERTRIEVLLSKCD